MSRSAIPLPLAVVVASLLAPVATRPDDAPQANPPAASPRGEAPAPEAPKGAARATPTAPPNMEQYQLVLLWRGAKSTGEVTPETQEIQRRHIGHLQAMGKAGKMVVAGPFSDQPDAALRGACLYRVGSVEEARALAEQDPAVQAGRLRVEVLTWWVEKGAMEFPRSPPRGS